MVVLLYLRYGHPLVEEVVDEEGRIKHWTLFDRGQRFANEDDFFSVSQASIQGGIFSDDEDSLQKREMDRMVYSEERRREVKEEDDGDEKWKINLRRGGDSLRLWGRRCQCLFFCTIQIDRGCFCWGGILFVRQQHVQRFFWQELKVRNGPEVTHDNWVKSRSSDYGGDQPASLSEGQT